MKKTLFSILCLSLLFSCTPEGRVFHENQELSPDLEWKKDDIKTFVINDLNKDKTYQLGVNFRYATGYYFDKAVVRVTTVSPSGTETTKDYSLTIRDNNGDYIGDPGFDIWDSEHIVETALTFPEDGNYSLKVEHIMEEDPLNYAMEVGLVLDGVK